MRRNDLTDVPGFQVGSAEDMEALTGCTVLLCPPDGAVGAVDQRGGAPGTRQTDALRPSHLVDRCHAVVLTGGSAFGLDCLGGVARYLEMRGRGFETRAARVPIVPGAVLYDLAIGRADVRPDAAMGERACGEAEAGGAVRLGNAGAGCGATVGKVLGMECAVKGGLGSASAAAVRGIEVGVVVAVNAFGDICAPTGTRILAGARRNGSFADTVEILREQAERGAATAEPGRHTVIAAVATNARLDKADVDVLARMANAGMARVVRPVHTLFDGDTVFAVAAGDESCDVHLLGALASDLMAEAIVRAIDAATGAGGVPALRDL